MSYIITAGGTAGHIYPALAVASSLQEQGKQVVFAGSIGGMEEQMAKAAGLDYHAFAAKGFDRQNPLSLVSSSMLLARSTGEARKWLKKVDAEAVAAFGGYASVPVGRAAIREGIPLLIHEQNSHMGWTNKHLSKGAQIIALAYEAAESALGTAEKNKVHLTGNPVRQEFLVLADADKSIELRNAFREKMGFSESSLVLLVFGGSQGARHINQAVVKAAASLMDRPEVAILQITGRKEYESVRADLDAALSTVAGEVGERWKLLDYCDEMPAAFAAADVVVSRAGASSLAELSIACKPAVLVPFPYATADHQRKNAESLVGAGAAHMVLDAELDSNVFLLALLQLIDNADKRAAMIEAAQGLKSAQAADDIAQLLIGIAK